MRTNYIQKSQLFLYPLLGFKRGIATVPLSIHMALDGHYNFSDNKLIVTYYKRNDADYLLFIANKIEKHDLYLDSIDQGEELVVIFDFQELSYDFECILKSEYSKMKESSKKMILDFFNNNKTTQRELDSYLNPSKYYSKVAEELDVPVSLLQKGVELCSKIQLDKEIKYL